VWPSAFVSTTPTVGRVRTERLIEFVAGVLGAGAAGVLVLAAAAPAELPVLPEELLLLELPQPASRSATPATARIDVLGT